MAYSGNTSWRREKVPDFKCKIILGEPNPPDGENRRKFYCPGDMITGSLLVNAPYEFLAYGFAMGLEGTISVHFDDSTQNSKILVDESQYVFGSFRLLGKGLNGICEKRSKIEKGKSYYPFEFVLPEKLPCSFGSPYGTIRYKLVGFYAGLYKPIPRVEKLIEVKVPMHVSELHPQEADQSSSHKPFTFTGEKGKFKICLKIDIDRKVLSPQESVPFSIEVWNSPFKKTKACFALIQKMDFKGVDESRKMKRRVATVTIEKTGISFGVSDFLRLPEKLPSTNFGQAQELMDVEYYLKLEVLGKEPERFFKEEIPIKVGWIRSAQSRSSECSPRRMSRNSPLPSLNIVDTGEGSADDPSRENTSSIGREGFIRIGGGSIPAYSDLTLEETSGLSNVNLNIPMSNNPPGYEDLSQDMRRLSF